MSLKNRFFSNESGAALLLIALFIPLLFMVVGVTIDLGRMYAVRSKAQQSLDAALLGAVSTASTTPVQDEALQLFNANYPPGYMQTTVSGFSVSKDNTIYKARLSLRVPSSIMQIFGYEYTDLPISSQVTNSSGDVTQEITLVLDNSSGINIPGMEAAVNSFASAIFSGQSSLPNIYISVVPFDVAVNVGAKPFSRVSWAQSPPLYLSYGGRHGGDGFFANRNPDIPTDASYNDVSDVAPVGPSTVKFRTPYAYAPGIYNNGDGISTALSPMWFAATSQSDVANAVQDLANGGSTRINVGLMWGWFTLSPNWTGRWDAGKPTLPLATASNHKKSMVLVVGSKNNVYLGGTQFCSLFFTCTVSNDNITTPLMCNAIKAAGIRIYVINYGPVNSYDFSQLANCSSGSGYYFSSSDAGTLATALRSVADSIKYVSLRLTQ